MRRNMLLAALVSALVLGSVGTAALAVFHFFTVVELEKLSVQAMRMNNVDRSVQALANETILYSQRNPAITSILEQFRRKMPAPRTDATSTNQPEPVSLENPAP